MLKRKAGEAWDTDRGSLWQQEDAPRVTISLKSLTPREAQSASAYYDGETESDEEAKVRQLKRLQKKQRRKEAPAAAAVPLDLHSAALSLQYVPLPPTTQSSSGARWVPPASAATWENVLSPDVRDEGEDGDEDKDGDGDAYAYAFEDKRAGLDRRRALLRERAKTNQDATEDAMAVKIAGLGHRRSLLRERAERNQDAAEDTRAEKIAGLEYRRSHLRDHQIAKVNNVVGSEDESEGEEEEPMIRGTRGSTAHSRHAARTALRGRYRKLLSATVDSDSFRRLVKKFEAALLQLY